MHKKTVLYLLIMLMIGGFTTFAQSVDQLKANVDDLALKIKALDDEIAAYNSKILSTKGEANTLRNAISKLESQRVVLNKEIQRTTLKIQGAQSKISDTQTKIVKTEEVIEKNRSALVEILNRQYQFEARNSPLFETLTRPISLSDTLDIAKRSQDVSKEVHARVEDLKVAKDDLEVTKLAYEESKKQLETLTTTLSGQKSIVEQTSKEKNTLLAITKNKESEYQKLLEERKERRDAIEKELGEVESKLKTFVDVSKLPKYGKGVLKWPMANVRVTQYFGNTPFASQNPQVYNGFGHNGIDLSAAVGTPILSAESGIVVGTGDTDAQCANVSYGKWVLIKHANGLTTLYAHLSRIHVKSGQTVAASQTIGLSGNTGYSTGPHLHFTVFASDSVKVSGPTEYKSKVCGTYMILPISPRPGYLNPLTYL